MKIITIIFNILITKSSCEPIYKYQLRGMYDTEKYIYINNTINGIVNEIHTDIIQNAKQNINNTYFDLYTPYFINKLIISIPHTKQKYHGSEYEECNKYFYQYSQSHQHHPYNRNAILYDTPIELLISKILDKLSTHFPDCNIIKIKESCYNIYLINY